MKRHLSLVLLALISVFALPAYQDYVIRGKRTEGRSALMDAAARLERYYSDNNAFAAAANTLVAGIDNKSANQHYSISITIASPYQTYTLTATPLTFSDDKCGNLTLTQAGTKGSSIGGNIRDCWGR